MQFKLVRADYGMESESDEKGDYSVNITLALAPIDNDLIPPFSKDIIVVSNNEMTGYEVDKQRQSEIDKFMEKINS
jgi:hypothetical protein